MKKTTKKIIGLVIVTMFILSLLTTTVGAARVGDVVGYAQPTDIVASINGYQLESYNVNGYTYICVEDLRYYGFDVVYDDYTRTLSVARNNYVSQIDPQNTNPKFWQIGSNNTRKKILYTDIKTYVDGYYVSSSNINGQTIISFNELSRFGAVSYDDSRREISLTVSGLNTNIVAELAISLHNSLDYNSDWKRIIRAKGNVLMLIGTARTYVNNANLNHIKANIVPGDKADIQETLDLIRANGYPVGSFYVEYRNSDGKYLTSFQVY